MSLIITFMLEPAKLQMNCASASGAMNARGDPTQLALAIPLSAAAALTPLRAPFRAASSGRSRPGVAGEVGSNRNEIAHSAADQRWIGHRRIIAASRDEAPPIARSARSTQQQ